jgi:hypothetical protein
VTHTRQKSKGRLGGESDRFARIPETVMQSSALATAPHASFRVLAMLLVGKSKERNGTLAVTDSYAAKFGMTSRDTVYRSLSTLENRKLIERTRKVKPMGRFPTLWAVTWWPIYYRDGQPLDQPEPATNDYAKWQPVTPTIGATGPNGENFRSHRLSGSITPTIGAKAPAHRTDLAPFSGVHHTDGREYSKTLERSPSSSGNGRPPSGSDSNSGSASEIPSKVRARETQESKHAIDRRIDVALQKLPHADDAHVRACVSGASIKDVKRRRAAAEKS